MIGLPKKCRVIRCQGVDERHQRLAGQVGANVPIVLAVGSEAPASHQPLETGGNQILLSMFQVQPKRAISEPANLSNSRPARGAGAVSIHLASRVTVLIPQQPIQIEDQSAARPSPRIAAPAMPLDPVNISPRLLITTSCFPPVRPPANKTGANRLRPAPGHLRLGLRTAEPLRISGTAARPAPAIHTPRPSRHVLPRSRSYLPWGEKFPGSRTAERCNVPGLHVQPILR